MEVQAESGTDMTFLWRGATARDACDLRRRLLTDTRGLAIGRVVVERNTSILPSDYLAQRLSLVPLACARPLVDVRSASPPSEAELLDAFPKAEEEGSFVELALRAECPATDGARRLVLAGDLVSEGARALYPQQPVALLGPGQALALRARAYVAAGGAMYRPTTVVHFAEQQAVTFVRPVTNDSGFLEDAPDGFAPGEHGYVVRTREPYFGAVPVKWMDHVRSDPVATVRFHVETDGRVTPREALAQVGVTVPGGSSPPPGEPTIKKK